MKARTLCGLIALALLLGGSKAHANQSNFRTASVTSSSGEKVAANRERLWLRLTNAGAAVMTCTPNGTATATTGYVLAANGGSVEFARPETAGRSYHCISASGSTLGFDEVTPSGRLTAPSPTPVPSPTPSPTPTA